jgi:SAM-dependent methyltransferase
MFVMTSIRNYPHLIKRAARRAFNRVKGNSVDPYNLRPELPLPEGLSEQNVFDFVTAVRVADAPEAEMQAYGTHDFRRFVYTWGLLRDAEGSCLELGGNPYFTTLLLREFSRLNVNLANYFGDFPSGEHVQQVNYVDRTSGEAVQVTLPFQHFNVESDSFPYEDNQFDVVIFAEIIEHLLNNPCGVLREIRRVMKPEGILILTTPNVARLENVARTISGENIYDPYSGHGPYGRHNREYTVSELVRLLGHEGFEVEQSFTADVYQNNAGDYIDLERLASLMATRKSDLGQYIFLKARKKASAARPEKLPAWLYRSYPPEQLD